MSEQVDTEASGARSAEDLIEFFHKFGYVVLDGPQEYETFAGYVAKCNIPTWTSIDRATRKVTFQKRILGSIEGVF